MAISSGSYTIGGTTPDYATIQLWEDDFEVTGLTGVTEGKCRAVEFSENVTIGGVSSSSSAYAKLTYDTGAFHGGDLTAGVQVRNAVSQEPTPTHCITISMDYTRVIGLNFNQWRGTSSEAIRISEATDCYIEQCLFWGAMNINADGIFIDNTGATDDTYISNCFFGWLGRTSIHVQDTGAQGTIYIYNCTAIYQALACQSSTNTYARTYVGMGEDRSVVPTSGVTWVVKNTYIHTMTDPNSLTATCFSVGANSNTTGSTNNGTSDSSAPGTSPQTSVSIGSQFVEDGVQAICGENTGNDVSATTVDSYIDSSNATTNYGSTDPLSVDDDSPYRHPIIRWNLSNVTDSARVRGALMYFRRDGVTGDLGNKSCTAYQVSRAWVESQVTYNIYSTGNNWGTAGALGTADIEAYNIDGGDRSTSSRSFTMQTQSTSSDGDVDAGEWFVLGGGNLVPWIQEAIDGDSPSGTGGDWFDIIWRWNAGVKANPIGLNSAEGADGERPEIIIWYDTTDAPFNYRPVSGGALDGNGTNLSSDGDYPISVDISGVSRDSTWDIGAARFSEDTDVRVSQAYGEVMVANSPAVRISQAYGEALVAYSPDATVSQAYSEVMRYEFQGEDELGVASVSLSLTTNTPSGQPVTFLYPVGDVTVTNFQDEAQGTTNIYASLDEGEPGSGSDYIETTTGGDCTYECNLTSVGDPEASDYHYVRWAYEADSGIPTYSIRATLLEGGTQRAQWIYNNITAGSLVEVQDVLSGAEADSITDYTNLRMRWETTAGTF